MKNKVYTVLKENMMLKDELQRLVNLIQENESKHKGFRLVGDAFITSDTTDDMDKKALAYVEEIFKIDKAALFIDEDAVKGVEPASDDCSRLFFVNERVLRYAYVEKRPYFGSYLEGLITDFQIVPKIGSYLIAPIIESGKIIASLNLYSANPEKLSGEAHVDFIQELALRIGAAIRKLHNNAVMRNYPHNDPCCGTCGKGIINSLLKQYVCGHKLSKEGLPFTLIDINDLKKSDF